MQHGNSRPAAFYRMIVGFHQEENWKFRTGTATKFKYFLRFTSEAYITFE